MSGIIKVGDHAWDVSGWLYRWTVEFLADQVGGADAARLRESIDQGLNWLDLDDFGPDTRDTLIRLIREDLVAASDASIPDSSPYRESTAETLRELVAMTYG